MKKIIYTSLFLLSLVFLGSRSAHAATVYQQTDYSSGATYGIGSGQSRFFLQSLGQVTSTFTLGKVSFRYNSTYSSGGGIRAITCDNLVTDMSQCTNFVLISTTGGSGGQDSLGSNDYLQYFTYSTTTTITAGKYLYVGIGSWGQNLTVKLYGSVANTYANGQCLTGTGTFNASTGACSTINDAYFIVTDQYGRHFHNSKRRGRHVQCCRHMDCLDNSLRLTVSRCVAEHWS
jgi:predicted outer membrane repeat protein